jgi:DNA-binding transcriptional MerR regulator
MVTSSQILKAAGLSAKTLTRWHQKGIIPRPAISTSPSGRGKMAYWPDWVLNHCQKIVELQRQGHNLHSAALLLEADRVGNLLKANAALQFGEKEITFQDGVKVNLLDLFLAVILAQLESMATADLIHVLVPRLRSLKALDTAVRMLADGYSPVLLISGPDVVIVYDVLVSHWLSERPNQAQPLIVLPLLPLLRKVFTSVGRELGFSPKVRPARKLWRDENGSVNEYEYFQDDIYSLEVVRETEKRIGPTAEVFGPAAVKG